MKLSIEIDCSPDEMRDVLGLPDIKQLQDAWLEKTGAALLANPANFSPEALVENWTKNATPALDALPMLFQTLMQASSGGKK